MISITLLTPTFNRAHTLPRLFRSLQLQNYGNLEWIIVDDGSTDNTSEIVNELIESSSFNIKYLHKSNGGKGSAINLGLKYVSSKYTGILDSDDELYPGSLNQLNNSVSLAPPTAISFIGFCDSLSVSFPTGLYSWDELVKRYPFEMWGIHLTSQLRRYDFQLFKDEKFFPEYNVWSEINSSKNAFFTGVILRIYNRDNEGLSSNFYRLAFDNPKGYNHYFKKKLKNEPSFSLRLKYRLYILILFLLKFK